MTNNDSKKLYYPSENVSLLYEEATREDFYDWFLQCTDWYDNAIQNEEFEGTIEEYADFLCDTELTEVEED